MEFRLIRLCNVIYMLASKAIMNRSKEILRTLIHGSQSSFFLGRLVINNVLVAIEHFHYLKKCNKIGKKG